MINPIPFFFTAIFTLAAFLLSGATAAGITLIICGTLMLIATVLDNI